VFFFGRFFEFFNKQRHFVIFSPFSTHAREQHANIQRRREREREIRSRVVVVVSVVFMVVLVEE